jgi:sugar phosphate isomerase/epimerase
VGSWKGEPCPAGRGGGGGGRGNAAAAAAAPAAGGAAPAPAPAAGGGGGRGAAQTPEQLAAAEEQRKWRQSLSMDIFRDLRKMYNDAGVTIYAVKNLSVNASEEELEFQFTVAKALGASHITAELPAGANAREQLKRVGDMALRHQMYAAYHTHAQGSMTAFDEAFEVSKGNQANVDLGHFVAGGNKGGTPLDFLNKFHDRIGSFHIKDRTLPEHCALNLPWGEGETPLKEILQLVAKNKWSIPATIELEYSIPQGSDAVQEVRKCVEYCRAALA